MSYSAGYLLRRTLQLIPALILVALVSFFVVVALPGDPVIFMAGETYIDPVVAAAVRERWGLDKPVLVRLGNFMWDLAHGDLGYSWSLSRPVTTAILERLPNTLLLMLTSIFFGAVAGFILGLLSARHPKSRIYSGINVTSLGFFSTPVFWIGLLFLILFGIRLRMFPTSDMYTIGADLTGLSLVLDMLYHLFLPALTLTLGWSFPIFYRITRASSFDLIGQDFVQTARAKGLSENRILFSHVGRNSLLPLVTTLGLTLRTAVTGAVLTETVFGWPGMGKLVYDSLFRRDYPLLLGVFIFSAVFVIVMNFAIDILYTKLDPRVALK